MLGNEGGRMYIVRNFKVVIEIWEDQNRQIQPCIQQRQLGFLKVCRRRIPHLQLQLLISICVCHFAAAAPAFV